MIPSKKLDTIIEEDEENEDYQHAYSHEKSAETDEVTFQEEGVKISSEEQFYRITSFPDPKSILKYSLKCTICCRPINRLIKKGEPIVHPLMRTLICKKCYNFYTEGEFSVDEDGTDKYCRWCGQGGRLYLCSISPHAFCTKCVRRNIKKTAKHMNLLDKWVCFICDIKPLYQLRAQCWAAQQYAAFIAKDSANLIMTALHKSPSNLNLNSCEIDTVAVSSKRQELSEKNNIEEKDSYTRRLKKKRENKYLGCESDDHNEHCGRTLPSGVRACRIKASIDFMAGIATNTAGLSKEAHKKLQKCFSLRQNVQSINSVESVLDMSTKLSSLISTLELGICSMRKGLEKYIEEWYEAVKEDFKSKEDEEEGAAAKRTGALKNKNILGEEAYIWDRNTSPNQQHIKASMFHPSSYTSFEGGFACQSTSQACFEGMNNSLNFDNAEDLSFIDQFLIPTADIHSDQESGNMKNPFNSFEFDDEWVAPPEIEAGNPHDLQGITENRRALFLLSSKEKENTSSPNFAENDRAFKFLEGNSLENRLSFSEELTEEEGRWINLADVVEQIGK